MGSPQKNASQRTMLVLILTAVIALALVSLVILWNSSGLLKAVDRRTQSYLEDVSQQTAQLIDARIRSVIDTLNLLADSVVRLEGDERAEFLSRKAEIAAFTDIALVSPDGNAHLLDGDVVQFDGLAAFQSALTGKSAVSVETGYILYMVPVSEDGSITGVIAGIKSIERMQQLITNNCFDGRGNVCILDQNGKIVVTPVHASFTPLIAETTYIGTEDWAVEMQENLLYNRPGSVILPTKSGTDILLYYCPISSYGWSVATMIPKDILTADVNSFIFRTFYIIIALMAASLFLFVAIIIMQGRYRARLEGVAFVDPLTRGPSIIRFRLLAAETIHRSPPNTWSVVSLNLKGFKLINDLGGSSQGDHILRQVYHILNRFLESPGELASRGEADNYYLLLKNTEGLSKRLDTLTTLLEGLTGPAGPLRVSLGVYPVESNQADLIAFQDRANLARNSVRDSYHSTCAFYSDEIRLRQQDELAVTRALEQAFECSEFIIFLQPKVRLTDGVVAGAEALVRWLHPDRGVVGPGAFIPLCEKTDLICRLDFEVFEQVCRFLHRRLQAGLPLIPISVNLSRRHLRKSDFLSGYLDILARYEIEPHWIEFELTESIMFSNDEILQAGETVREIRSHGFRCSLDDFGSGYSALGLLKDLPIDCLKLDRQFFVSNFENPKAKAVIQSVIQLANRLQLETVAEGIEEEEQVSFLRKSGCSMVQGYFFSKPLSVADFEHLVDQHPSPFAPREK